MRPNWATVRLSLRKKKKNIKKTIFLKQAMDSQKVYGEEGMTINRALKT
jgi:hypothetical protein